MDRPILEGVDPKIIDEVYTNVEALSPETAKLTSTLAVDEHYTFVAFLPPHIQNRIEEIEAELAEIQPDLLLNPPHLTHITIFHCSIDQDFHLISQKVRKSVRNGLSFRLFGLLATAPAAGLAAYPTDSALADLRRELFAISGQEFPNDYRGLMTWATFVRYQSPPSEKLLKYFRDHSHDDFGEYKPDTIHTFRAWDKNLTTTKLVENIS